MVDIVIGLEFVKSDFFDLIFRFDVFCVLIVVVLGKLIGDFVGFVKVLKYVGVIVFCVGVGNGFDLKEFDEMVMDLDSDYVFIVDVIELGLVVKVIKGKVCDGNWYMNVVVIVCNRFLVVFFMI